MCIEIDIVGDVNTVTHLTDIANAFSSHYTTLAEKILKNTNRGGRRYYVYLKKHNPLLMITIQDLGVKAEFDNTKC